MSASPKVADREPGWTDPEAVVDEHLAAFEARDVERVLATFATDASFTTADGTVVGRTALRHLFEESFALPVDVAMDRQVTHVAGDTVVCEIAERLVADGLTHALDVAAFYTVRGGEIVRVRVYRDAVA